MCSSQRARTPCYEMCRPLLYFLPMYRNNNNVFCLNPGICLWINSIYAIVGLYVGLVNWGVAQSADCFFSATVMIIWYMVYDYVSYTRRRNLPRLLRRIIICGASVRSESVDKGVVWGSDMYTCR